MQVRTCRGWRAITEILNVMPMAPLQHCPCRMRVKHAVAVVRRARTCRHDPSCCTHESFLMVRRVLGGCIPESVMSTSMGEVERRAVEYRIATAIGNAQDIVYDMMCAYHTSGLVNIG